MNVTEIKNSNSKKGVSKSLVQPESADDESK